MLVWATSWKTKDLFVTPGGLAHDQNAQIRTPGRKPQRTKCHGAVDPFRCIREHDPHKEHSSRTQAKNQTRLMDKPRN
eukprot:5501556-Amphidinium_carterae.1